jgi:hypothetical protein
LDFAGVKKSALRRRGGFCDAGGMGDVADLGWLEERVKDALEEAGATLLSLPTAGAVPPLLRRTMPRGFLEAAIAAHGVLDGKDRLVATQREIEDMAVVYGWITDVPDQRIRRVLLLRSLVHPRTGAPFWGPRKLGTVLDVHPSTIDAWHAKGIRAIARQLHKIAVPAPAMECGEAA